MKRSEINEILREGEAFIRSFGYALPPFADWTPAEMRARERLREIDGIVDARLGWDVTDYGQGRFDELGLFLFTVRNGRAGDRVSGLDTPYAEKIMISRRDQVSPMHRHQLKTEDIVNRGGVARWCLSFTRRTPTGVSTRTPRSPCRRTASCECSPPGATWRSPRARA